MDLSRLVWDDDNRAALKHERLRDFLLAELRTGKLLPGDSLPTELDLSRRLRISRNTIRQAFSQLENSGWIKRVRGKGTFVSKEPPQSEPNRLRAFALVLPELRGGYYPSLIRTFEQSAADRNYQVITCNSSNDIYKQGDVILQLIDKQVAGVALVPATTPSAPPHHVIQLQKHNIPVVFCHRRIDGVAAPLLSLPFYEVGRRVGRVLVEHRHKRVAYMDSFRDQSGELFENGFRSEWERAGRKLPAELVRNGTSTSPDPAVHEKESLEQLKSLLDLPEPPTAIVTGFTSYAELLYTLLGDLGLHVPSDISLVSFGGVWREGALARRLTSVTVDESATAQRAVELLCEMCNSTRPIDDDEEFALSLAAYKGQTLAKHRVRQRVG